MFLIINPQRTGSDTAAVITHLGLLVPDTFTGPRRPPLRGLHGHVSALTQSPRQRRCKYCHAPCHQDEVVGKLWEAWRSSKFVLYTYTK